MITETKGCIAKKLEHISALTRPSQRTFLQHLKVRKSPYCVLCKIVLFKVAARPLGLAKKINKKFKKTRNLRVSATRNLNFAKVSYSFEVAERIRLSMAL
jgi:hypothetical protein